MFALYLTCPLVTMTAQYNSNKKFKLSGPNGTSKKSCSKSDFFCQTVCA